MTDDLLRSLETALLTSCRELCAVLQERRTDEARMMIRAGCDLGDVEMFLAERRELDRLWVNKQLARLVPQLNKATSGEEQQTIVRRGLVPPVAWPPSHSTQIH